MPKEHPLMVIPRLIGRLGAFLVRPLNRRLEAARQRQALERRLKQLARKPSNKMRPPEEWEKPE